MISSILEKLKVLVACDTQNPPRAIQPDSPVFDHLRNWLGDCMQYHVQDFGQGRVNLLAVRGRPTCLFHVHLDTVPVGTGWSHPPLQMTLDGKRVVGRGVCDIKGAAACLVVAANQASADDVAILFSTDEEGAESCCVREFCASRLATPFQAFVVAEPTAGLAVVGHRGYLSMQGLFLGQAGHTSQSQLLEGSANHQAALWIAAALKRAADLESTALDGQSTCFNVGRIDGGIKNNMVADRCQVGWSARLPAGYANDRLLQALCDDSGNQVQWTRSFDGAPLPGNLTDKDRAVQFCHQLQLPLRPDVDFWTEAAIFSGTGKPTIVLGPGDIAQAHTADEWVTLEQLQATAKIYLQIMNQTAGQDFQNWWRDHK